MPESPPAPSPALEPHVWRALGLDAPAGGRPPVVAIVGGGGKTSLLYRLGREATALGHRVVISGTVRFTRAPYPHATPLVLQDAEDRLPARILDAWASGATLLVVRAPNIERRGRLAPLMPETVDALAVLDGLGAMFFEADGSRQRPFKAPAPHEPVIPTLATHVVVVVSIDALDAPLDEAHVHRPEYVRAICDRPTCDADLIARVLASPLGGRQHVEGRTFAVVVNKADLGPAAARRLAERIAAQGVPRVVIARLAYEDAPVDGVVVA